MNFTVFFIENSFIDFFYELDFNFFDALLVIIFFLISFKVNKKTINRGVVNFLNFTLLF